MMIHTPITAHEGCISLPSAQMELPPEDFWRQTTFIETILRLNNIYTPFPWEGNIFEKLVARIGICINGPTSAFRQAECKKSGPNFFPRWDGCI